MRLRALIFGLAIPILTAGPALAQSSDRERSDGGLRVSGGGVAGYVGGSGSVSGTITGPSGTGPSGGAARRAPARAPASEPAKVEEDPGPTAVTGGVVVPVRIVPRHGELVATTSTASAPHELFAGALAAIIVAGLVLYFRSRPEPRPRRTHSTGAIATVSGPKGWRRWP